MATNGRPPKPAELKRAQGNPGRRKLPELAVVQTLPMAITIPDAPADLGKDGLELWGRAWSMAITWLSPDSDLSAIENACRAADDLTIARARYRATTEPADARAVVALTKSLSDALASLGFDPTSRSRLGVAEVKRASALDNLIAKRQAK